MILKRLRTAVRAGALLASLAAMWLLTPPPAQAAVSVQMWTASRCVGQVDAPLAVGLWAAELRWYDAGTCDLEFRVDSEETAGMDWIWAWRTPLWVSWDGPIFAITQPAASAGLQPDDRFALTFLDLASGNSLTARQTCWAPCVSALVGRAGEGGDMEPVLAILPWAFWGAASEPVSRVASTHPTQKQPIDARLVLSNPEPASLAVWTSLGLTWAGANWWRRRTRVRGAGRIVERRERPAWAPHVRAAIHEIIDRGRQTRQSA